MADKTTAWRKLVDTVDRNSWERPYFLVMGRLRSPAPPTTEALEPAFLQRILDSLFPGGESEDPIDPVSVPPWDDLAVSEDELRTAVRRMQSGCVAPGPDGITNHLLGASLGV